MLRLSILPTRNLEILVIYLFIDVCLYSQDIVMLNGFGTVVNALGKRVKPYLPQICGTILWRLNNKSAKVRQQAADLISRIAQVMMTCGEVSIQLTYTVGITFHKWPPSISDHFINLTNRPQFSIVYTLIDHRNDIIKYSKLKWNHSPGSLQSFECFMASFLLSIRV